MLKNDIEKLSNFRIHASGHYIVITATLPDKINNYTFLATSPILKHILCDMNQIIVIGQLSKIQFAGVVKALKNMSCGFKIFSINNKLVLVSENKIKDLEKNKFKVKVKKSIDNTATSSGK